MDTIKLGFTIKASKKDREYFDSEIRTFYEMIDENEGNLSSIDLEKRYMEFLEDVIEGKALIKEYGVDVIKEFIGDLDNRYDIDINHRDEPYAIRGAQMFKKLANGMRRVLKSHEV
jgi:hypothetical protein